MYTFKISELVRDLLYAFTLAIPPCQGNRRAAAADRRNRRRHARRHGGHRPAPGALFRHQRGLLDRPAGRL